MKPARYQLLMAARHILAPEEPPAMTANKMKKYCESITKGLWNDSTCERTFKQAAVFVTKAATGGVTRDVASTAGFTQRVRDGILVASAK